MDLEPGLLEDRAHHRWVLLDHGADEWVLKVHAPHTH